jgi:hypothetical protein
MRTSASSNHRRAARGYASLLLVSSVAAVLLTLIVFSYRSAIRSQQTQAVSQLRVDYAQKENAFLRALVGSVPNKAIGIMQNDSAYPDNGDFRWEQVFRNSLDVANAETAISPAMAEEFGLTEARKANSGNTVFVRDSNAASVSMTALVTPAYAGSMGAGFWLNPGVVGDTIPEGYPDPLVSSYTGWAEKEPRHPVVSPLKRYADGSLFKAIPYPNIHFGYGVAGESFVAKRNWWAFKLNLGAKDLAATGAAPKSKTYVLSLYEIPSQLPISAAAFTQIGGHEDGTKWKNVTIGGGVFGQRVSAVDGASVERIASRLGVTAEGEMTVGGMATDNSFGDRGVRESYEIATDKFFPISEVGDSGRVSFVALNRGNDFFDRFAGPPPTKFEAPTDWDQYSIGAKQCAMTLDIVSVVSSNDQTPTRIRFSYKKSGAVTYDADQSISVGSTSLPANYPFSVEVTSTGRTCLVANMEALQVYLVSKGADPVSVNNSLVVNADYTQLNVRKPSIPSLATDLGLILRGGADMSRFTAGFSLVTNFRLYLDDDFNVVKNGSRKYPAASLFAPEQRYGANADPWNVDLAGQLGSFASDDGAPVHLMDLKTGSGSQVDSSKIRANLLVISDPEDLPPIYAMNWLTIVQEKIDGGQ